MNDSERSYLEQQVIQISEDILVVHAGKGLEAFKAWAIVE